MKGKIVKRMTSFETLTSSVALSFALALLPIAVQAGEGMQDANFNGAQKAKESSGADLAGMIASMIGAAAMAPPCFAKPPCQACCMMMAQALAQIPASAGASGGATTAGSSMSMNPNQNRQTAPGDLAATPGLDPKLANDYKKLMKQASDAGIKIGANSVTLPNGSSYGLGSDTSASGLKQAGFSEGDISKALGIAATVAKNTQNITGTAGVGDGASGGGSGGGGASGGSPGYGFKPPGAGAPKSETSVAGMARRLGDDRIGVSADNIWSMITRRYKVQDEQNTFHKK